MTGWGVSANICVRSTCVLFLLVGEIFAVARAAPLKGLRSSGFAPVKAGRLYYEIYGQGAALVFLHSGLADSRMWDDQVRSFAERYTVVRFDARGFGRSDPPTGPFVPADDLRELLTFLKIDRACIIGLSLGGVYAIDFAAAHQQSVSALVVVSSGPGWLPYSEALTRRTSTILTTALEKGAASAVEGWMNDPMLAAASAQPKVARQIRALLTENAVGFLGTRFMGSPDIPVPKLSDFRMPTLIMVGDRDDPELVDRARTMTREIAGARQVIVRGSGHMVNLERPREFNRALAEFLRTVPIP